MKNFIKKQKGITLIALVITIIVLLILAGVAISMLSGENGILKQAVNAKTQTEKASTDESVKLAVLAGLTAGHGEMNVEVLEDELSDVAREKIEIGEFPATVTINGNYYTIEEDGTVIVGSGDSIPVVTDVNKLTTKVEEKTIYEDLTSVNTTTKRAVIPKGFRVSSVATEQKIDTGLVVIAPDGSEFVWVPVDDPSSMYGTKDNGEYYGKLYGFMSDGTTRHLNWYEELEEITDEELQQAQERYDEGLNEFITQLATQQWDEIPEGVKQLVQETLGKTVTTKEEFVAVIPEIYEEQVGPRPTTKEKYKEENYTAGSREPAVLYNKGMGIDDSANGIALATLQSEFDEMIKYVGENKGFYVGRYETSWNSETEKVQSVKKVTSATAADTNTKMWYGLYEKQKLYGNDVVGSSMIWGSQYDQMMIWMKKNGYTVTSLTPKKDLSNNDSTTTGKEGNPDIMNNVHDLIGCHSEWTLEAESTDLRVLRGGLVNFDGNDSPSTRFVTHPEDLSESSRLTLYVK